MRRSLEDIDVEMVEVEHSMDYLMRHYQSLKAARHYEVNRIVRLNKTKRKGKPPKIGDKDITYANT